jgi:hypothetical protein
VALVLGGVDVGRLRELLHAGGAGRDLRLVAGAVQRRQQHGDQYGNDADHHQQLDQREGAAAGG